jgi:hypothetical protein
MGKALEATDFHIFCFIYGLDECQPQDKHPCLIDLVKWLAGYSNVKLVVSGRPWPTFEAAFGGSSNDRLNLGVWNRDAIANYVFDKLEEASAEPLPPELSASYFLRDRPASWNRPEPETLEETVIWSIIEKADGVFLWAHLVTSTLQQRLRAGLPLQELHQYVDQLPGDVADYYRKMLFDRIHSTWQSDLEGFSNSE